MYLEASLYLSFDKPTKTYRVARPQFAGGLLRVLSLGVLADAWEREAIKPAALVRRLARAFRQAGITNLVSLTVDDIPHYHDHLDKDDDLEPVLGRLEADAQAAGPDFASLLELVATVRGEQGLFVVQVTARRTHPIDTPPIQVRVYALLGEFDVGALADASRGVETVATRLKTHMLRRVHEAKTPQALVGGLAEELRELCERLEDSLRSALSTHRAQEIILGCVVRPAAARAFDEHQLVGTSADPALFRAHPGFREATYYLQLWGSLLTLARARISHTLVVDPRGRPVLHVGDEALDLTDNPALAPQSPWSSLGSTLDLVYFSGNDYEDELRAARCLSPSESLDGDAAWRVVRTRELGVKHRPTPGGRLSLSDVCPGLGTMFEFSRDRNIDVIVGAF